MLYCFFMRNNEDGQYTIVFVSKGAKRVRTIRTTSGKLILSAVIIAALFIASAVGFIHETMARKQLENRIEVLNEEISTLTGEKTELQE